MDRFIVTPEMQTTDQWQSLKSNMDRFIVFYKSE